MQGCWRSLQSGEQESRRTQRWREARCVLTRFSCGQAHPHTDIYLSRHVGDLGNMKSKEGKVKVNLRDKIALLSGQKPVLLNFTCISVCGKSQCVHCAISQNPGPLRSWAACWSSTRTRTTSARGLGTRRRSPRRRATQGRGWRAASSGRRETR